MYTTDPLVGGVDTITGGSDDVGNIILGGAGSKTVIVDGSEIEVGDEIIGGTGNDILVGDGGYVSRTGLLVTQVATTGRPETGDEAGEVGGNDIISSTAGDNVILGGAGNDHITAPVGNNIILGDNGVVNLNNATSNDVFTTEPETGGIDIIIGGDGANIILGGAAGDKITGGTGNDVILGDGGYVSRDDLDIVLQIESLASGIGGDDEISAGAGDDLVLGGAANDTIHGGLGADTILGDNGLVDYLGDGDAATLDRVVTTDPLDGGADTIYADEGEDIVFGGTGNDEIHGGAGDDRLLGDHGEWLRVLPEVLSPTALPALQVTSIFIESGSGAGDDLIYGDDDDDLIIGQQGTDTIHGGADDDDIIGGHHVAGGHDSGDLLDGGTGDDVIAGDNALITRLPVGATNPRMRVLEGKTIYGERVGVDDGEPLTTDVAQLDPTGVTQRLIQLLDHADTTANVYFGADYVAGGANDDLIFGQLGNDVIQGDGSIDLQVAATREASVELAGNNLVTVGSLQVLTSEERTDDGDDYIEGGGGDDVVFGNLGQDDIIGGSSSLFGLDAERCGRMAGT